MSIRGKGFFTWRLPETEGGDPAQIAAAAKSAGLSHVLIKIADGKYSYHGVFGDLKDYVTPTIEALRQAGIHIWGWHYIYGGDPIAEANIAIRRVKQYGIELYGLYCPPLYDPTACRFTRHTHSPLFVPLPISTPTDSLE
jgi:hypothetical protein